MPIVATVRKSAKLPSFIDVAPPNALRREYGIIQRYLPWFSRAFMRVSRNIYDPGTLKTLDAGIKEMYEGRMTIEEVVNSVDWYNPADPLATKRWELLGASLDKAYLDILDDAAQGEFKDHGWPLVLEKANIGVPISESSLRWIRLKSASQVAEISDQQKTLLRGILTSGFEQGERPKAILAQIEELVGLTEREATWVQNRRDKLSEKLEGPALTRATDRYAKSLLRKRSMRIARTETLDAYSEGLNESWLQAKDAGFIDDAVMEEWVELTDSPRTCKICKGLGGQQVPVGENFVSEFIGEVSRPPAHPHCRCTRILVFIDEDDLEETIDRSNRDAQRMRDRLADTLSGVPVPEEGPVTTVLGIPAPRVVVQAERKIVNILTGRSGRDIITETDRVLRKFPPVRSAVRDGLRSSLGGDFVQVLDRLIDDPELNDRIIRALVMGETVDPKDKKALVQNLRLLMSALSQNRTR